MTDAPDFVFVVSKSLTTHVSQVGGRLTACGKPRKGWTMDPLPVTRISIVGICPSCARRTRALLPIVSDAQGRRIL